MTGDRVQDWSVHASSYTRGPGRPVRLGINRNLRGGKIDFVALSDDDAWTLILELTLALERSRHAPETPYVHVVDANPFCDHSTLSVPVVARAALAVDEHPRED